MTAPVPPRAFAPAAGALGLERAVNDASRLLIAASAHSVMLAELGAIDLPPAARADAMQLRGVAGLYLASTLEAAGLIAAVDDLVRLLRSGALPGTLGDAGPLVADFWGGRNDRVTGDERLALFARLFGAPAGPIDALGGVNAGFEELLLDFCDSIMDAADGGGQSRLRAAGIRLAENLSGVADDFTARIGQEIVATLGRAVAILNSPGVRALVGARTLWDVVARIDRQFRRPARPTLGHLRRGRAGMAVLAWLAEVVDRLDTGGGKVLGAGDAVVDAAIDWVDESLSVLEAEERAGASAPAGAAPGGSSWRDLAR